MQPCYLPWLGHLRLMAMADHFVFLDDAQYSKNSWANRNKVLLSDGRVVWLTIPVAREHASIKLNNIRIDVDSRWRRKHSQTLKQAYGQHPYFSDLDELLNIIENGTQVFLADINCDLLHAAARRCKFRAQIARASTLGIDGRRSERLERICHVLHCESYVSTPGARDYLEEDAFGLNAGLQVEYMNINFPGYLQKNSPSYVPQMSFLDVLANVGWDGLVQFLKAQ